MKGKEVFVSRARGKPGHMGTFRVSLEDDAILITTFFWS